MVRTFAYEQYGRPESTTTTIGSDTYVASTTYDQFGRVFQRFDGAETYSGLEYQYTPDGHLDAAIESRGSASVTVERYRITAKDARGQVTGLSKGGIDVSRTYSADTGRLQGIYAQNLLTVTIQDSGQRGHTSGLRPSTLGSRGRTPRKSAYSGDSRGHT